MTALSKLQPSNNTNTPTSIIPYDAPIYILLWFSYSTPILNVLPNILDPTNDLPTPPEPNTLITIAGC